MSAVVERTPEDGRLLVRPSSLVRRRPVLSFLAVLGIVALVLGAVGRSGVANPQVRLTSTLVEQDGACSIEHAIVNEGLRPVEVEAASWQPFVPFTLGGGTRRAVRLPADCMSFDLSGAEVRVRSVDLGIRRTVRLPF